jgi:hypothetical protein
VERHRRAAAYRSPSSLMKAQPAALAGKVHDSRLITSASMLIRG